MIARCVWAHYTQPERIGCNNEFRKQRKRAAIRRLALLPQLLVYDGINRSGESTQRLLS
jgi:hypothetical protein